MTASCTKDERAELASEHRDRVDAFSAKLLHVESQLGKAPVEARGLTLPAGESLRASKTDKPANTLVIAPDVFRDVVAKHVTSYTIGRSEVGPRSDPELSLLIATTYNHGDYDLDVYQRVFTWFPNIRYVAVLMPIEKRDYDQFHPEQTGMWRGRVAVFDLTSDTWLGAVAVGLEGPVMKLDTYVNVDTKTNRVVSEPFTLADRDVSLATSQLDAKLDHAVEQALSSGTSVTDVSQRGKRR